MKNTAAIALLVARAAAQDRPDMAMDRTMKDDTQKFQAAAQEDRCKDTGVDTADAALVLAVAAVAAEDLKIVATGKLIATAIADQSTKTIALAKADVDNKAKVDDDIAKDKLELAARRAWDAKKALEVASIVVDGAQLKVVNKAQSADDLAKAILGDATSGATRAVTDATAHVTDEATLETSTLATLNLAMTNWKGRATATASSTTVVDAGRPGTAGVTTAFVAAKPSALLATALTNLTTAVGKCTPASGNWADATADKKSLCTGGTATNLVKYALRKKLGVDTLATSKASRETYLDAYCRAAQQVGAPDADIKDGKAYWSRANPGVRLDFLFTAAVSTNNHADRKNNTLYLTTWTFETLGAVQTAVKVNDSAIAANALALMTDVSANQTKWAVMKCLAATAGAVTGNAGRVYGSASGIANATIATSPTKLLADAVSAAQTIKNDTAATKLEGTFRLWKTAATTAMTGYDTMISSDTDYVLISAHKCKVAAAASVIKTIALATEAEVAAAENVNGTATKAKRPTNLIAAVSSVGHANATALIVDQKAQCGKLPSMGLYVNAEGVTMKPLLFKEVCQGVEYLTTVATAPNRLTFIAAASFISSAPYDATGTNYITLAAAAVTNTHTCQKRKNTNGVTWRNTKANLASNFPGQASDMSGETPTAITGGVYKPTTTAGSKYLAFHAQIAAWVTSRKLMYVTYSDYLVLKEVVTATGKLFRKEKDTVLRNAARLTGVKGTDNTNGNLTDLYETQWRIIYGAKQSEIPSVPADMSAATYTHMAPKTLVHPLVADTGKYALWVAATKVEADAKKAWDAAKVLYDAQKAARIRQEAVKAKAVAELAAIKTVQGPLGSATVLTGTGGVLKTAKEVKVITAKAVVDATALTVAEKLKYDTALGNSNTAKTAALTIAAYSAIKVARDLVDTAVLATVKAIADDSAARGILAGKLVIKVAKDVLVAKALTTCKNTKYDAYKATLSTAVADRNKKLASIKVLLDTKDKAKVAAGATGARCNKGLSQGNGSARGAKPCTAETDCCGAAKGPVLGATAKGYWKDAPVMTIETCQPKANKTYKYAPPRAPMQVTDPAAAANAATQQDWPFVCIGGASKLAAAASALATAAYMMA